MAFDTRQVIRGLWGFWGGGNLAVATSPAGEYGANGDYIQVFRRKEEGIRCGGLLPRPFGAKTAWVQFFTFCGELYALSDQGYLRISDGGISTVDNPPGFRAQAVEAYVPPGDGGQPAGGGTALEQVNRLDEPAADLLQRRRLRRLPAAGGGGGGGRRPGERETWTPRQLRRRAGSIPDSPGGGDGQRERSPGRLLRPGQGPGDARCSKPTTEHGHPALSLYGDGSNTCIYSGVTRRSPLGSLLPRRQTGYPGGQAVSPPSPGFCATGKPPGLQARRDLICLQPLTLPDRCVTAGFYLRPLKKPGELRPGSEWPLVGTPDRDPRRPVRLACSCGGYHRDERQARLASGGGLLPPGMDPQAGSGPG